MTIPRTLVTVVTSVPRTSMPRQQDPRWAETRDDVLNAHTGLRQKKAIIVNFSIFHPETRTISKRLPGKRSWLIRRLYG